MRSLAPLLVGVLCLLAAPRARADIESAQVKAGLVAYRDLDYPKAVELLDKALEESLTREELITTYRTLAFCHFALEQVKDARTDFEKLLRLDPTQQLDRTIAPRLRALFEEARTAVATGESTAEPKAPRAAASLETQIEPDKPHPGDEVRVAVPATQPAQRLDLFFRARGEPTFTKTVSYAGPGGRFEARVPGSSVRAPALEYYAVALDGSGAAVASAGSLASPLALAIADTPVYKRAWFWAVIGAVAVVAVAGVLVGTLAFPSGDAQVAINPH